MCPSVSMQLRCFPIASKKPFVSGVVVAFARQLFVTDQEKLIDGSGKLLGASLAIDNPKSQSRALSLVGSVDWIQARPVYIPSLIAAFLTLAYSGSKG